MRLILFLLLVCGYALGVTQDMYWYVPHGSSLPAWGLPVIGGGPGLLNFSANTLGINGPASDFPTVVSAAPATNGLMIVRGGASTTPSSGNCGTKIGEGYTCSRPGTGTYTVSFSTTFQDTPSCTCTPDAVAMACVNDGIPTSSGISFAVTTIGSTPTAVDQAFGFICIGQRNSSN